MKSLEFIVIAAFVLFWLIFFLLLCYFSSRKKRNDGRLDHRQSHTDEHKSSPRGQYVGAIGWFQRYRTRQNESKHELNLL